MTSFRVCVLALTACSYHPPDSVTGDGSTTGSDSRDGDVPNDLHLLFTEVEVFGGPGNSEFVEIYNPTAQTVALDHYYVSDDQSYWSLPGHVANTSTITLIDSDFVVQFPPGSSIPPGGVIVLAVDGPDFMTDYGMTPDFTINISTASVPAMLETVATPGVMTERFSNDGEMLALFEWDGASDTVHDVDLVVHGNMPSTANSPEIKKPVDGPDGDAAVTSYTADAMSIGDMMHDSVSGESYKRIMLEGADEVRTGGNGITGHDETSEAERTTWDSGSLGVTPGTVPVLQ